MIGKNILLAVAVMAVLAAPVLAIASGEAYGAEIVEFSEVKAEGFQTNSDGTLHVMLKNTTSASQQITVTATDEGSGAKLAEKAFDVPANTDSYRACLTFRLTEAGWHDLTVTCTPASLFYQDMNAQHISVEVTESLWSKWTTYVAIAIVALVVLIAAYLVMRNAPSKKADTTFTELERKKSAPSEEPAAPTYAERRRYKESEPAAKPEKKAESFTELEKKKAEEPKKEAPKKEEPAPKKEAPAPKKEPKKEADGGKLKYKSSRRK